MLPLSKSKANTIEQKELLHCYASSILYFLGPLVTDIATLGTIIVNFLGIGQANYSAGYGYPRYVWLLL